MMSVVHALYCLSVAAAARSARRDSLLGTFEMVLDTRSAARLSTNLLFLSVLLSPDTPNPRRCAKGFRGT